MTVSILAFGIAKDIFGASSIEVDLPDSASAGDLKSCVGSEVSAVNATKIVPVGGK